MKKETQKQTKFAKNFFLANPEAGIADLLEWVCLGEGQHTEIGHALAKGQMQARSIQRTFAKGQYSFK